MDIHCDEKNISSAIDRIHRVLAEEQIKIGDIDLVFDFVKEAVFSETVVRKDVAEQERQSQGQQDEMYLAPGDFEKIGEFFKTAHSQVKNGKRTQAKNVLLSEFAKLYIN